MLPIVLDGAPLRAGVAAAGEGLTRRLEMLAAAGVMAPRIFAGGAVSEADLATLHILFIAGLSLPEAQALAARARQAKVLVNVEDAPELCDFHVPAQVRRGDLILTVSTGGRAPGLARALREDLQTRYGPEWDDRLNEIAALRRRWKAEGAAPDEISARTRAVLSERGWLP